MTYVGDLLKELERTNLGCKVLSTKSVNPYTPMT